MLLSVRVDAVTRQRLLIHAIAHTKVVVPAPSFSTLKAQAQTRTYIEQVQVIEVIKRRTVVHHLGADTEPAPIVHIAGIHREAALVLLLVTIDHKARTDITIAQIYPKDVLRISPGTLTAAILFTHEFHQFDIVVHLCLL